MEENKNIESLLQRDEQSSKNIDSLLQGDEQGSKDIESLLQGDELSSKDIESLLQDVERDCKAIETLHQSSVKKVKDMSTLLQVDDLNISFALQQGKLCAVNGISYYVRKGEVMGLVGESGSGKSVSSLAVLSLLRPPAVVSSGSVTFEGRDILKLKKKELLSLRGNEISMIFQNPASCLDPVFTIGRQMIEAVRAHNKHYSKSHAKELSINMLREVMIRDPERVMKQYSFELSGGMCQRILIAMALLSDPKLLIADEPTTALDVTTQSQIVQILKKMQQQRKMAIVYITHNLGIVAELCDRVSIMCGGYILEQGSTEDLFYRAEHPYTKMLHKTIPRMDSPQKEPFLTIEGTPLNPLDPPDGCVFHPRCPHCMDICRREFPPKTILSLGHSACCWLLSPHGSNPVSINGGVSYSG